MALYLSAAAQMAGDRVVVAAAMVREANYRRSQREL
jgi:hypothetical protein